MSTNSYWSRRLQNLFSPPQSLWKKAVAPLKLKDQIEESFCDSSVTFFKVKWPPTRGFEGHLVSAGISQSYLCLLPGLTCSLWKWAKGAKIWEALHFGKQQSTRSRNLSLVSIVSVNIEHWQTEFYMAKIVKTSLVQIPSATLWHSENCPSCWLSKRSFGSVTTSLCLGRFWKPMEVTTFADKFGHMLTGTGATCLKLCRAESFNVLYLAILCDLSDPFQGQVTSD